MGAATSQADDDHRPVEPSGLAKLRDLRRLGWLGECRAALQAPSVADERAEERADR
jgi:hypothetical protein